MLEGRGRGHSVVAVVEHGGYLAGQPFVGREQAMVGVQLGRVLVEVAGAEVGVSAGGFGRLALRNEQQLGVHLLLGRGKDDVGSRLLQLLGPVNICFLVEAGLQLHHHCHLLAVLHGLQQGLGHGAFGGQAVEGNGHGRYLRVGGGLA